MPWGTETLNVVPGTRYQVLVYLVYSFAVRWETLLRFRLDIKHWKIGSGRYEIICLASRP